MCTEACLTTLALYHPSLCAFCRPSAKLESTPSSYLTASNNTQSQYHCHPRSTVAIVNRRVDSICPTLPLFTLRELSPPSISTYCANVNYTPLIVHVHLIDCCNGADNISDTSITSSYCHKHRNFTTTTDAPSTTAILCASCIIRRAQLGSFTRNSRGNHNRHCRRLYPPHVAHSNTHPKPRHGKSIYRGRCVRSCSYKTTRTTPKAAAEGTEATTE